MKTTLIQLPEFTWKNHAEASEMFCGSIHFCSLVKQGQENGKHYFRMQNVAFPDAVAEAGSDKWQSQPLDLKASSIGNARDLVETIYFKVFEQMEITTSVED